MVAVERPGFVLAVAIWDERVALLAKQMALALGIAVGRREGRRRKKKKKVMMGNESTTCMPSWYRWIVG